MRRSYDWAGPGDRFSGRREEHSVVWFEIHQAQGNVLAPVCGANISVGGSAQGVSPATQDDTMPRASPTADPQPRGTVAGILEAGTAGRKREQVIVESNPELDSAVDPLQWLRCN